MVTEVEGKQVEAVQVLREIFADKCVTVAKFAALCKCAPCTVYRWMYDDERGTAPDINTLWKLAQPTRLDVPLLVRRRLQAMFEIPVEGPALHLVGVETDDTELFIDRIAHLPDDVWRRILHKRAKAM